MSTYYMGTLADLSDDSRKEVTEYIQHNSDGVTLGTMQNGGVHLTMMGLLKNAAVDEFYMMTTRGSQKEKNIAENHIAEVAVSDKRGYVILSCTVEVLDDKILKSEKWEDWMAQYHPEGPDSPDYVLLHFTVQNLRVMI